MPDALPSSPLLEGRRPLETNPQHHSPRTYALTEYQQQVFRDHIRERERLISALDESDDPTDNKTASKIDNCCRFANFRWAPDRGEIVIGEARCRSRLCPRCGRDRARSLAASLTARVKAMDSPRLLTLTLKSSRLPLPDQLRRLTACFSRLRRRRSWSKHYSGGFYVIECSYNGRTGMWHPHVHAVVDGHYWQVQEIAALWEKVTGDSKIVDIRVIHARRQLVNYLTNYLVKTGNVSQIPTDEIAEWATALRGLRMVATFGDQHGLALDDDVDDEKTPTEELVHLEALVCKRDQGDAAAASLLAAALACARTPIPPEDHPTHDAIAARHQDIRDRLIAWQRSIDDQVAGIAPRAQAPDARGSPPREDAPRFEFARSKPTDLQRW